MISRICKLLKIKQPEANEGLLEASGTGAPAATANTYQTGCIYKRTDGGAETAVYINEGTFASPSWAPALTTSNELQDLPDFGAMTYGAGKILVADGDSYEEVALSGDATLASTGAITVTLGASVTPGTVTASKATVVSADKDLGDFRNLDCVNLDAGADAVKGTIDIFPTTTARGKIIITCADNATAHNLTITNAALNGASVTATFPAVTGYVTESTAALDLAEVDVLQGAGTTVVASKAVIADGDKDIVGLRQIWVGVNGATGVAGVINVQDGANPGATVALSYADVLKLDAITNGTVAASKCVVVDAYKTARWGGFNTAAAVTDAVPFASVPDTWTDGQLDVFSVFGASASDLTSGKSAKCIRARHVVNATSIAHESYGVVGQLVVKDTTLAHLHAGIMGTFEGHTSGVVIDGSYTIGAACVIARLGGHAAITATDPVAGFLAWNNGSAALASGVSAAFATSSASASYPWVLGLYMPVGSVTQAVRIGAFDGSAATTNAIPFSTAQNLWADGQLSTMEVFGASAADLTSAYSAKCIRARHIVSGTGLTVAHETYGIMGQVVVKGTTLTHLHAGLIGTFEGHTSGAVSNGAYMYSTGAIMARVGGGAAITATKDVCGVIAFLNGAAMASGACSAFAVGDQGTAAWTNAIAVERATNLFDLPAAGTDPVITNALVPAAAPDAGTVGADACLRVLVNNTAYYIPLYDTLHA